MKRIVLTGAAGKLGSHLREQLLKMAEELVSSDIAPNLDGLRERERYVRADLRQYDEIHALLEGADMVVHFGAIGDEAPFDQILGSNIVGAYNVWEAASRNKVRRIVFASSIHVVGMHAKNVCIGTDAPHRPDSYYGLAKCFAEDLASLYWDKRGVEAVCLRILSCTDVANARAVGSWLSYPDLIHLVERAVDTPITGFCIIYGVSNNDRAPVDNARARFLGYRPNDNAERYAAEIFARTPPMDPRDAGHMAQGGAFATVALGSSGIAMLKTLGEAKNS